MLAAAYQAVKTPVSDWNTNGVQTSIMDILYHAWSDPARVMTVESSVCLRLAKLVDTVEFGAGVTTAHV